MTDKQSTTYHIYINASCPNKKGEGNTGAWAYMIRYPDGSWKEKSSTEKDATNNHLLLKAANHAFKQVEDMSDADAHIVLHTNSTYVSGYTTLIDSWHVRNGKDVKHYETWRIFDAHCREREVAILEECTAEDKAMIVKCKKLAQKMLNDYKARFAG